LLVVTHGDIDHAGGAAAVVRAFGPRAGWLPARPACARDPAAVERLVRAARRTGALVRRARRGDSLQIGGARLDVLNPPAENRPPRDANEDSLVAVLSAGGRRILLAGDAGAAAESSMRSDEVRADLLKAGHHGSRSASSEAFLAAVKPSLAFISCGRMNRFGHPHRETLARLQSARVRVCRTDLHGAVWVELLAAATRLSSSCALSASSE
ncbi:MAG TPA: MBL fold metallo-hydrolase, partial [Candidatus Polarisedimenticolia bacterium]|nr:MBL fold metallo-hydrolase [Candidatus Polarisedimenticolia bacterium]